MVGGAPAAKAARQVSPGEDVRVLGPRPPFVSRAGLKLDAALDRFEIDPAGKRVLDAGSSTGGFTDCVLQRGASLVVAVDVGTNQLHEKLRADSRVEVREQTDIRSLEPTEQYDLVVGDLSFISLKLVLPLLVAVAGPGASLVLLVKPQFEAGAREASQGRGIIRDPGIWSRVLIEVRDAASESGAAMLDLMPSPITGSAGNVEFVAHFVHRAAAPADELMDGSAIDRVIDEAVDASATKAADGTSNPPREPT